MLDVKKRSGENMVEAAEKINKLLKMQKQTIFLQILK